MQTKSSTPATSRHHPNVVAALMLAVPLALGTGLTLLWGNPLPAIVGAVVGLLGMQAPKVAKQWERAVVLKLGR
jgi:hypothetical protein